MNESSKKFITDKFRWTLKIISQKAIVKSNELNCFYQAAKEELRTIKRNQKRNALLDAARVASILDYYWITAAIITVSKLSFSNLSIVT